MHRGNYRRYHARALAYAKRYVARRYRTDLSFRMGVVLRSRIYAALKGRRKDFRAAEIIGCSIDQLRAHLESKFKPGMSWANHSVHGWHIDHQKPCCKFDLSKITEVKKCFHFSNLQPLWASENLSKQGFYVEVAA